MDEKNEKRFAKGPYRDLVLLRDLALPTWNRNPPLRVSFCNHEDLGRCMKSSNTARAIGYGMCLRARR